MNTISTVISEIGTQQFVAGQCGVRQSAVSAWIKRGSIPVEYCATIERLSHGRFTRRDLRPTDWHRIWPELADVVASPAAPAAQGAEQGGAAEDVSVGHGKNFCPTEPLNATQQSCGGL